WLEPQIEPAAEARIMVAGQVKPRVEQLHEREGFLRLALSDCVRLIGDDYDIGAAEFLRENAVAFSHRAGTVEHDDFEAVRECETERDRAFGGDIRRKRAPFTNRFRERFLVGGIGSVFKLVDIPERLLDSRRWLAV